MNRRTPPFVMLASSVLACVSAALAAEVRLKVSAPSNNVLRHVEVRYTSISGEPVLVPTPIPPGLNRTATWKRDQIVAALQATGRAVLHGPGADELTILDAAPESEVLLRDLGTGEVRDSLAAANALNATVAFPGLFEPFDYRGQPAIFTAGIVTDVGELSVGISAQELNFQTDGPIICQALFQRLAPRAPDYGALINYAGDRLEIYFDPAYTVTTGGPIFGTTSRSAGNFGSIMVPPPTPPDPCWNLMIGDVNGDGAMDNFDIDPFVLALIDPVLWQQSYGHMRMECVADINLDGAVDNFDIDAFVAMLVAPRVVVRIAPAAGEVFCRYEVESSTNSARVKRTDILCVNCPADGTDCTNQKKFRLLDAAGNPVADGTWKRLSEDCEDCPAANRRGYGF